MRKPIIFAVFSYLSAMVGSIFPQEICKIRIKYTFFCQFSNGEVGHILEKIGNLSQIFSKIWPTSPFENWQKKVYLMRILQISCGKILPTMAGRCEKPTKITGFRKYRTYYWSQLMHRISRMRLEKKRRFFTLTTTRGTNQKEQQK